MLHCLSLISISTTFSLYNFYLALFIVCGIHVIEKSEFNETHVNIRIELMIENKSLFNFIMSEIFIILLFPFIHDIKQYVIDRPQGSCGVWDIPKVLRGGAE